MSALSVNLYHDLLHSSPLDSYQFSHHWCILNPHILHMGLRLTLMSKTSIRHKLSPVMLPVLDDHDRDHTHHSDHDLLVLPVPMQELRLRPNLPGEEDKEILGCSMYK